MSISNLEKAINILANGAEVLAMPLGIQLLLGAMFVIFIREWAIAVRLAVLGIVGVTLSLVTPSFLNWLVEITNRAESLASQAFLWVLSIVGLFMLAAALLTTNFLPSFIAFKRKKENRLLILALNILLGWLPIAWQICLVMSLKRQK